jgi:trehalose-phosphatase
VVALLSELSHSLLRVAVISGRDTDALATRIPVDGVLLIGNHGLEERDGESRLVAAAQPFVGALERAAAAIGGLMEARRPGVRIERKRASLSVHFRNAPDSAQAEASLRPAVARIAQREQLRLHAGRMVLELRPPLDIDKGEVLRRLARTLRPDAIVFIGDDRTDGDAFAALKTISGSATLAVGVRSEEVPVLTFIDCDLTVDGVDGVTCLLRELADRVRAA